MQPRFFSDQSKFREWLEENHDTEDSLLVGFWKVGSGKPSMTWSESVDQALCFGWIDGVRKRIDADSYSIRFTRRRPASIWSKINIDKANDLIDRGLMRPAGLATFRRRDPRKSAVYSYENAPADLDAASDKAFKKNKAAWNFFNDQPPSYKKLAIYWIMSAKQQQTRERRLERVIRDSAEGKRI